MKKNKTIENILKRFDKLWRKSAVSQDMIKEFIRAELKTYPEKRVAELTPKIGKAIKGLKQ